MLRFEVRSFDALTNHQLYDLLRLRTEVFVVEQECPFQDMDGHDLHAQHLLGMEDGELVACARWYWDEEPDPFDPQGSKGPPAMVLGRIVTALKVRHLGYGKRVMQEALDALEALGRPIRMHAQARLERFYRDFGFETLGEPFDEDGIPHLLMVRDI